MNNWYLVCYKVNDMVAGIADTTSWPSDVGAIVITFRDLGGS